MLHFLGANSLPACKYFDTSVNTNGDNFSAISFRGIWQALASLMRVKRKFFRLYFFLSFVKIGIRSFVAVMTT